MTVVETKKTADIIREIKEKHLPELNKRLDADENIDNTADYPKLAGEFYKHQKRIALKNFGIIDPDSIEDYIALGGYEALRKAIFDMNGQEIIDCVTGSGLRGRGGAGFPTGVKWQGAYDMGPGKKYVVMNADEGDPGAFMDRSIMEGDPHSVLEGMAICGRAIGADEGFIYIRAEYPKAVKRLEKAIADAKAMGLLGDNIMGSGFSFDISLRLGSGAFVCGEGTALMESIEGRRGMPRPKVFRTTVKGLWGKPTVLNNVETFANIPFILDHGAEYYHSIGTEDSSGTKVFALVGKVVHSGLVEVPMGTTINEIVFDIGGGIPDGKKIKAVQTGGPSGGCIPPEYFDLPIDFATLKKIGSIMGSGGMVVMDETDCMVDIARFFMEFSVDESCGKCTPCREGTMRVLEMLTKVTKGEADESILDELMDLSDLITKTSLCGLGQSACNPVVSTIHYFKDEYLAHVNEKKCPAHHCKDLLNFFITDKCIGCTVCAKNCPVNCISGERKEKHIIDQNACIKCGNCESVCPVHAIIRE
ncbi:MAG: NADH-ubiquinone oxidoreductase-F iron-sulfur binding region domain-containing protein [Firmicutes bacterium]|nr:4Fe-4S binding protein [Ezakiella sp.]MDD7761496.1 NADH-ubiquinone oxidoreductase-F iron-sulfur binding region domain-containing protein [Bacillota bacterium]